MHYLNEYEFSDGGLSNILFSLFVTVQLLTVSSHCMQLHKPPNTVCWPFTLSLSPSIRLWTLDLLHIQSGFNPLPPHSLHPRLQEPVHLWSNPPCPHGWVQAFPQTTEEFVFGVLGIWSFLLVPKTLRSSTWCFYPLWPWTISIQSGL